MASAADASKKTILYEWEGKDKKGNKQKGLVSSPSVDLVKAKLRRQGIVAPKVKKKRAGGSAGGKKVTAGDIADLRTPAHDDDGRRRADGPVVRDRLERHGQQDHARHGHRHQGRGRRRQQPHSGHCANTRTQFDDLFCSLTEAGEQSGTLETLLNEIATYKEKSESLKKKIKKAMFYPIAVLIVAFIVTAILLVFVVPQFEALFAGMGGDLPAFTQADRHRLRAHAEVVVRHGRGRHRFRGVARSCRRRSAPEEVLRVSGSRRIAQGCRCSATSWSRPPRPASLARWPPCPRPVYLWSKRWIPSPGVAGNSVFEKAILKMKDEAATGQQLCSTSIESSGPVREHGRPDGRDRRGVRVRSTICSPRWPTTTRRKSTTPSTR